MSYQQTACTDATAVQRRGRCKLHEWQTGPCRQKLDRLREGLRRLAPGGAFRQAGELASLLV